MKKRITKSAVILMILLIVAAVSTAGCGDDGSGKTPSEVAEEAVQAAFDLDCGKMYDLTVKTAFEDKSREDVIKECEEATAGSRELLESMNAELTKVESKDESIDGDKATVTVVMTVKVMEEEADQEQAFELVKEDGEWKITDAPQL